MKTAIVLGGTGLVGRHLLAALVATGRYGRILALVRRVPDDRLVAVEYRPVADFARLGEALAGLDLNGAEAFSTLGPTRRQAGSKAAFRAVDFGYNHQFAQSVRAQGATHFLLLSALGASAQSWVFYNQVKGELEQAVRELGFVRLSIFQPSLLLGGHEGRRGERLAQQAFEWVQPLLPSQFAARPIEAQRVAQAMVQVAGQPDAGPAVRVYSNLDMLNLTGTP